MSMPPQGGWPPQGPPPNQGPPNYGPPNYGPPPQPPPPGWQQGPWPPQEPRRDFAPQKSNSIKRLLVSIAALLVVGVSIGATLLFTRDSGGGGATPTSGVPSDFASANDTGPVAIITDEPTCKAYIDINNGLALVETRGWSEQRGLLGNAADWTPDQRSQMQAVATAMRNASDQMVALAQQTPHRVVRELYEQFIAYNRAYADKGADYKATDNFLASVSIALGNTLNGICNAITYKSASRSLAVDPVSAPTHVSNPGNPANPQIFVTTSDSTCDTWISNESGLIATTNDWQMLDTTLTASQWTPEQRATQLAVLPKLSELADEMESLGRKSDNPVLEDFALLGALYLRAYVSSGETYTGADTWLSSAGLRISNVVSDACRAVGS